MDLSCTACLGYTSTDRHIPRDSAKGSLLTTAHKLCKKAKLIIENQINIVLINLAGICLQGTRNKEPNDSVNTEMDTLCIDPWLFKKSLLVGYLINNKLEFEMV